MRRFHPIVVAAFALGACATTTADPKPISAADTSVQVMNANGEFVSDAQNLADRAVANEENFGPDGKPCPRFMQNISTAEKAVDERPRDYPHML